MFGTATEWGLEVLWLKVYILKVYGWRSIYWRSMAKSLYTEGLQLKVYILKVCGWKSIYWRSMAESLYTGLWLKVYMLKVYSILKVASGLWWTPWVLTIIVAQFLFLPFLSGSWFPVAQRSKLLWSYWFLWRILVTSWLNHQRDMAIMSQEQGMGTVTIQCRKQSWGHTHMQCQALTMVYRNKFGVRK